MINFIGITKANTIEKHDSIDRINIENYQWFWVDFNEPTMEETTHLSNTFRFHVLAIEDCLNQTLQRPKLDYYDNYTFFITHTVRGGESEVIKEELDFFISENFMVTFHLHPSIEVTEVFSRLAMQKDIQNMTTQHVFYELLDKIVDNYFPVIYKIEDKLDEIENNTLNRRMDNLLNDLFETRYLLLTLMHSVHPMRDLLYRMLNSQHLKNILKKKEYFSDIYDHLLKLSDMVMSNREITADIRDNYLSLNSHQTNNVMKVLTIMTSIFAPLTFVAGIFGMNFHHMPELEWEYGYPFSLILMGLIGLGLLIWFKKKKWF
ncbi:magnesium/cobalt transporter CorA [Neobacillus thermocopriae]|uniref:Magnesium transport protein CorA n=1 Tax=Neobacillus thermocopriae TaxID=1215031 RepID=A0A6B3TQY9_9BACI|nr:magnesium/cobalt transporter CorA [Neobacillus thermocopriae]MED3624066.1 magnesium/cobalt transporter CorA [Neobacillus thermocopriae]MED3713739.1 magnesium/cobalt transporter CorA [Neobacillus thermocopriae]NEX78117.1 magnesium/cobalt transporter CorA [Neobacillus thermocopriae]